MKRLHNLSVRKKFAIAIIPLVVIILIFDFVQVEDHFHDYHDSRRLNKAIIVGIEINHAIHELQKERSITAGYLSGEGSLFSGELLEQRRHTDSTLQAFYEEIERPELDELLQLHANEISYVRSHFDRIEKIREQADHRSITAEQAIEYYSEINETGLNTVNNLINETRDKQAAQQVHAIIYFLKAKEHASIERAIGTQAFSLSHLPASIHSKFSTLVAAQNAYLDAFLVITNPESDEFYQYTVTGPEVAEVQRMRDVLFLNDTLHEDPNHWYEMSTAKINLLKDVEDFMSENIHAYTETIAAKANKDFWTFLIVDILVGAFTLILISYILTHLLKNVSKLEAFTRKVSAGDLSGRVKIDTQDEIGQYAKTFNVMIDEINKSHTALKEERAHAEYLYENIYKQSEVVFENVQQGIFLLDEKFTISNLYSKALEVIFDNKQIANENLVNFMRPRLIPRDLEALEMFMKHLFNPDIDEDVLNQLNPIEHVKIFTEVNGEVHTKYIKIAFTRIEREGVVQNVMVTVSDETESVLLQRHLEEADEQKKLEMEQMLSILKIDPSVLRGFLHNTHKVLRGISERYEKNRKRDFTELLSFTFQTIHNLKGNSIVMGLQLITDKFHMIEESITHLKDKTVKASDFLPILYEINEVEKIMESMTDMLRKVANVYNRFSSEEEQPDANFILIDALKRGVKVMTEETGKAVDFTFKNDQHINIPKDVEGRVKDAMIQLIKNSVAHGIEDPKVRIDNSKLIKGNITIALNKAESGDVLISYRDDGQGLDLEKIKEKAIQKEMITEEEARFMKPAEVVELLFREGFSTSAKVDNYSGRGQGLCLVKSIIEELGGEFTIDFDKGHFFEMIIKFPVVTEDEITRTA